MRTYDKKYILILGLFVVSTAISWHLYFKQYLQKDTYDIAVFPKIINSWVSKDLPIDEADYDILETHNVFVRRYTNPEGKEAYLFIVYSQNNRKVSHPPEVCYTGGGVTILDRKEDVVSVPSVGAVELHNLTLSKGDAKQIALYWFKVGNTFTA